ncbi:DUF4190 domain-containing protein [Pseudokineococcus sp. 1T1Z-3]|uniref:DUF4190 domain-containing protein n=1 Tax=Pseudokineococcus sp. 1T1Z-3 TaxID=3132745 RepID=UPI0030962F73
MSTPGDQPEPRPEGTGDDAASPSRGYGEPPAAGYGVPADRPRDGGAEAVRYGGDASPSGPAGGGSTGGEVKNGVGVGALVVGIVAVLLACTSVPGILLGVVALVLGVVGRKRVARGDATNKGVATTGLALGIAGIVLGLVFLVVLVAFTSLLVPFFGEAFAACEGLEAAELDACLEDQAEQAFG